MLSQQDRSGHRGGKMTIEITEGLLWFDDSKASLEEKIKRAAARYYQKFWHKADVCYVHPLALEEPIEIDNITVTPLKTVPLHHFWLGRRKENG